MLIQIYIKIVEIFLQCLFSIKFIFQFLPMLFLCYWCHVLASVFSFVISCYIKGVEMKQRIYIFKMLHTFLMLFLRLWFLYLFFFMIVIVYWKSDCRPSICIMSRSSNMNLFKPFLSSAPQFPQNAGKHWYRQKYWYKLP